MKMGAAGGVAHAGRRSHAGNERQPQAAAPAHLLHNGCTGRAAGSGAEALPAGQSEAPGWCHAKRAQAPSLAPPARTKQDPFQSTFSNTTNTLITMLVLTLTQLSHCCLLHSLN